MRRAPLAAALLTILFATGCSGKKTFVIIKGKVTSDGKTLLRDRGRDGVTVTFHSLDEPGASYVATFNSDTDDYYVYGPAPGKGLPTGKYKVTVNVAAATASAAADKVNQQYGTPEKSPIEVEVTGPEPPVNIDLAKFPPK